MKQYTMTDNDNFYEDENGLWCEAREANAELTEAFNLAQTLVQRTEEQATEIARLRDEITTLERALSVSDRHVAEIVLVNGA